MSEISNEELDMSMAIKVMGWRRSDKFIPYGEWILDNGDYAGVCLVEYHPSSDLTQAFECVEKVCPETHLLKLFYDARSKVYRSFFQTEKVSYEYFFGVPKADKSPARTVCLAIKAFKEGLK